MEDYIKLAITIFSAVASLFSWLKIREVKNNQDREIARQAKKITIALQYGSHTRELPVELRRSELSRAEILGRLGMIPMKDAGKRFSITYFNKPEFIKQIHQAMDGLDDSLITIPCDKEEFEQFQ